jgi:hypothetical protein
MEGIDMRPMTRSTLSRRLLLLAALAPLAPAVAQTRMIDPPLHAGARLRVTTLGAGKQTARFRALSNDTLLLEADSAGGDAMAVPLEGVTRIEVSRGRGRMVKQGLALGTVVGLVAGIAAGAAYDEPCDFVCPGDGLVIAAYGLLGTGVGMVAGGLVGAAVKGERWERANIRKVRSASRLGVGVVAGGGGLGMRIAF